VSSNNKKRHYFNSCQKKKKNLPVVELVRHTLLDSSIGLDINNITNLVSLQVSRQGNGTMFPEVTGEHVAGTSTDYIDKKKEERECVCG
jgi:hypothetical protein